MTLIELLVALAVLGIITVAFGTIMTQSQRVVDKSNALMQANATASAIAQVLRDDLARFCPQGFLAVHHDGSDANQRLVFTSVGPFTSLIDLNIKANAARIDYGLDSNDTLWRRAILLSAVDTTTGDSNPNDDIDSDVWLGRYDDPNSPSYIDPNDKIPNYCSPPPIPLDPNTPDKVNELWPLLARPCSKFQVSWWNKINNNWDTDPKIWTAEDFANPNAPSAIKVNFRLRTGPKDQDYLDYEVICPIRP
jgi:prepilin-type N-terminal cleavage/methylation domain-containing protein